jgi:hypothetical protein
VRAPTAALVSLKIKGAAAPRHPVRSPRSWRGPPALRRFAPRAPPPPRASRPGALLDVGRDLDQIPVRVAHVDADDRSQRTGPVYWALLDENVGRSKSTLHFA